MRREFTAGSTKRTGSAVQERLSVIRTPSEYSTAKPAQLSAMLRSQTHHHHPTGADLKQELALYAEELKLVSVMKPSTDPAKFADKIFADVLA